MEEFTIERPNITYEITANGCVYQLDSKFIFTGGGSGDGGDADTLNNQSGSFYLSRANHTGSQAISTVTGLQTTLDTLVDTDEDLQAQIDLKLNTADYNDRFLGLYSSFFDLEDAHPTANAGDYAQVDLGIGSDVIVYAWDVSDAYWAAVGSSPIANTDALPEGSSNLYFTGQRVRDTPLTGLSTATATPITASDSLLSAAGKLQAQVNASAPPAQFFYLRGGEYTQDFASAVTTGATISQNNVIFAPVLVFEDVLIDQYTVTTGTGAVTGALAKVAIYEVQTIGTDYILTRITDTSTINVAVANTGVNIAASLMLNRNKTYFLALKGNLSRTYVSLPVSNSMALGFSGATKITHYAISSPFADDLPASFNTAAAIKVTTPPLQFRFRVASL